MIYFLKRADPARTEKSPSGIWGQNGGTEADFRLLHVNIYLSIINGLKVAPLKAAGPHRHTLIPLQENIKKTSIQIIERYLPYRLKGQKIMVLTLYYAEWTGEIVFCPNTSLR